MDRVKTIAQGVKDITLIDLSHCSPDETIKVIQDAKGIIQKFAPKSGLVMTDVSGAVYTKEVAEGIKGFVSHNTPYVKASAVVGAEGVAQVLLQTVIFITRRELKSFSTREEASKWLASHA